MQKNVNDWERVMSVAAGAALLAFAAKSPRYRSSARMTGLGLVARGVSGICPVNSALGRRRRSDDPKVALSGPRGIHVTHTMAIARRPEEIFEFWRDLRNLATFMPHVKRVDMLGGGRSHWVVRGPAGLNVEWDAEIINEVRPEILSWQSLPGSDVVSAGSVHFRPLGNGVTQLDVVLQYDPPAGKIGAALARLMGDSPERMLRDDLGRLKQLLETHQPAQAF